MTHNELAARIERAEGPDRALDLEIARLQDAVVMRRNDDDTANEEYTHWRYTGSLDAAMQLVPEGYNFSVDRIDGRGGAVVNPSSFSSTAAIADAATPALALCAAALRARSAS
jgi:hypothetical protein